MIRAGVYHCPPWRENYCGSMLLYGVGLQGGVVCDAVKWKLVSVGLPLIGLQMADVAF